MTTGAPDGGSTRTGSEPATSEELPPAPPTGWGIAVYIFRAIFRAFGRGMRTRVRKSVATGRRARRQAATDVGSVGEYLRAAPASLRPTSWRNVTALVGFTLILAGILASVLPVYLLATFVWAKVYGHGRPFLAGYDRTTVLVCTAVALVAPVVGRTLVSVRRRVALFLRRFGPTEPTKALGFAIETAMGRSWRLVTLDDSRVAPLGVRKGMVRAIGVLQVVEAALFVLGLWWATKAYEAAHPDKPGQRPGGSADIGPYKAAGRFVVRVLGLDHGQEITRITFVRAALLLVAVWLALRLALTLAGILARQALRLAQWVVPIFTPGNLIKRGEEASRVEITHRRQVRSAARRVVRQSRRLFSPQLVVVRVATEIWTDVVRRFASVSALVITDVTELSENLLWEMETLRPVSDRQWIFVGHHRRLQERESQGGGPRPDSDLHARLTHLLGDEPVLLYGDSPEEMTRFATALSGAIRA